MGKYVVFKLGNEDYGLDISQVRSIEPMQPITQIPTEESSVKGVITLRGELTPIIDMRSCFKMSPSDNDLNSRIVVVFDGKQQVGLIVDEAKNVLDIPESSIQPLSTAFGGPLSACFDGIANLGAMVIAILKLEQLFDFHIEITSEQSTS